MDENKETKIEKISIGLPGGHLTVIDEHEKNRSAYFQRLVENDLKARGLIAEQDNPQIAIRISKIVNTIGDDAKALDFLDRMYKEALAENAAKVA